jgi:hypothetical protein
MMAQQAKKLCPQLNIVQVRHSRNSSSSSSSSSSNICNRQHRRAVGGSEQAWVVTKELPTI